MNFIGRHTPLDWAETSCIENERAVFEYSAVDRADGAVLRVVVRQTQPRRRGVCDWEWSATVDGHVFSCGVHHGRDDRAINVARYAMKEIVIDRVNRRKWLAAGLEKGCLEEIEAAKAAEKAAEKAAKKATKRGAK